MQEQKDEFHDREEEMLFLTQRFHALSAGEFIILYGRRRVGKTELVRRFLGRVGGLYLYVDVVEPSVLLHSFEEDVLRQTGETVRFRDWGDFFAYIAEKAERPFVLVIDEFQRFLDIAPDFLTRLQRQWDETLRHRRLMLVAVGSSIGMMQSIVSSRTAPLYGRATARRKIGPFRYLEFRGMFPGLPEAERIEHYAVFGGTPHYLSHVRRTRGGLMERITRLVLERGGPLSDEPGVLLEAERIRVGARYNAILQAVSQGRDTAKEIGDYTGIPGSALPAYLRRLDDLLDLVGRGDPVLGKQRHGKYRLRDNFFAFWYRFVFPHQAALNLGNVGAVREIIQRDIQSHVGRVFETVVRELLGHYAGRSITGVPIGFEDIGSWWDRQGNEIDLVAPGRGITLVGEVKWTGEKVGVAVLKELVRKGGLLPVSGRLQLLMVSRSGFTEECLAEMDRMGCLHLDLAEMGKLFDALNAHSRAMRPPARVRGRSR